jgi:hypothetical protein
MTALQPRDVRTYRCCVGAVACVAAVLRAVPVDDDTITPRAAAVVRTTRTPTRVPDESERASRCETVLLTVVGVGTLRYLECKHVVNLRAPFASGMMLLVVDSGEKPRVRRSLVRCHRFGSNLRQMLAEAPSNAFTQAPVVLDDALNAMPAAILQTTLHIIDRVSAPIAQASSAAPDTNVECQQRQSRSNSRVRSVCLGTSAHPPAQAATCAASAR